MNAVGMLRIISEGTLNTGG